MSPSKVNKTIAEINEKSAKEGGGRHRRGNYRYRRAKSAVKAAQEVDVVTTGTFGPMCSSGAFMNFGHSQPRIKAAKCG